MDKRQEDFNFLFGRWFLGLTLRILEPSGVIVALVFLVNQRWLEGICSLMVTAIANSLRVLLKLNKHDL